MVFDGKRRPDSPPNSYRSKPAVTRILAVPQQRPDQQLPQVQKGIIQRKNPTCWLFRASRKRLPVSAAPAAAGAPLMETIACTVETVGVRALYTTVWYGEPAALCQGLGEDRPVTPAVLQCARHIPEVLFGRGQAPCLVPGMSTLLRPMRDISLQPPV